MTVHESTPPPPDMPPPTAKTPPMVVWALVLSILGFCGITAIIGIVLGFVGRGKAKEVGKGVGQATAAIIIGFAWIVLGIIGFAVGGGETDTTTTTEEVIEEAVEETPDETETANDTSDDDFDYAQDIGALDVTVDELPAKWNAAVEAYGLGNPLPETVEGTDDGVGGLNAFYETENGNYVSISWSPETGQVVGITVGGFTDDSDQATAIIANAAAMTHATSTLTPAEAELLIVDDLVGTSLDTATADDLISEIVELDDRAYRFSLAGNTATFSVDATG